jgi:hypothetical protein
LYLSYLKLGYSQILFFGHPIFRFKKHLQASRRCPAGQEEEALHLFPDGFRGAGWEMWEGDILGMATSWPRYPDFLGGALVT